MSKKRPNLLWALVAAVGDVLVAALKIAPLPVFLVILLIVVVPAALYLSVSLVVGVVILIVLTTTVAMYIRTRQYGEAALAFVAGLLTAFAVSWTRERFIAFVTAWVGFTLFVWLTEIISLRGRLEHIYRHAAAMQSSDASQVIALSKQLEAIGNRRTRLNMLAVDRRAQVVRLLVFRKIDREQILDALTAIESIQVTTQADLMRVTNFVADLLHLAALEAVVGRVVDIHTIIDVMRGCPVPPEDFFLAFERSRGVVLSGKMAVTQYFQALQKALEVGVSPDEMGNELSRAAYQLPPLSVPNGL